MKGEDTFPLHLHTGGKYKLGELPGLLQSNLLTVGSTWNLDWVALLFVVMPRKSHGIEAPQPPRTASSHA